jgi:hypothetical protein
MRKITQISAVGATEEHHGCIYALCEDGTVWRLVDHPQKEDREWKIYPPIPQKIHRRRDDE